MKYFIITNPTQDDQLREFQEMSSKINNISAGKLTELVKKFVDNFRNDDELLLKDSRISRDIFLGSLRRIDYSYDKIIQHSGEPIEKIINGKTVIEDDGCDITESMMLVFFVNAKFALEIIKKTFIQYFKKQNQNLLNDITVIRNYLAHADEKFFVDKQRVVARSCRNPQFKEGLDVLEIFDNETAKYVAEINFSINIIYRDICSLIEKISSPYSE